MREDQGEYNAFRRNPAGPSMSNDRTAAEVEAGAIQRRAAEWNSSIRPMNVFEVWMTERMASDAIRIERCEDQEAEVRSLIKLRAKFYWDQDRRLDIEKIALGLAKRPSLVVAELRGTRYGCEWLATRWRALAAILRNGEDWSDEQRTLALDLMGVSPELRNAPTAVDVPPTAVDVPGEPSERTAARLKLAESWLRDLETAAKPGGSLERIDHEEYRLVSKGVMVRKNPVLAAIKREADAARRRIQWAWTRIKGNRLDLRKASCPADSARSIASTIEDDPIDDEDGTEDTADRDDDGSETETEATDRGRLRSYTPAESDRMRESIDRMLGVRVPARFDPTPAPPSPAIVAAMATATAKPTASARPARPESRRERRRKAQGR